MGHRVWSVSQDAGRRRQSYMACYPLQLCYACAQLPDSSHIKFTPNSRFILASTQDSTIRLWTTQTSKCVKTYTGHTNRTYCIFADFAPGRKHIVSGSEDMKIYFWDLQTREIVQVLEGHRGRSAFLAHVQNPALNYLRRCRYCGRSALCALTVSLARTELSRLIVASHAACHRVGRHGEGFGDSSVGRRANTIKGAEPKYAPALTSL